MAKVISERIKAVMSFARERTDKGADKQMFIDFVQMASQDSLSKNDKGRLRQLLTFVEATARSEKAKKRSQEMLAKQQRREKNAEGRAKKHKAFVLGGGILGLDPIKKNKLVLEACACGSFNEADEKKFGVEKIIYDVDKAKQDARNDTRMESYLRSYIIKDGIREYELSWLLCYIDNRGFCTFHRYFVRENGKVIYSWEDLVVNHE